MVSFRAVLDGRSATQEQLYELAKVHPECVSMTPNHELIEAALERGEVLPGIEATFETVFETFKVPYEPVVGDMRKALPEISEKYSKYSREETTPGYCRHLARWCSQVASAAALMLTSTDDESTTRLAELCFTAGYLTKRLELQFAERYAQNGKNSHKGSQGPRKPKRGSIRDYFEKNEPEWRTKPAIVLARLAHKQPQFEKRDFSDVLRECKSIVKNFGG
jgi:hypothetical protein